MSYYDDIINLPHHVSTKHPRMSMYNRSAQFSPFAALTGYEKAIEETRRKLEEYQGGTKSLGKELEKRHGMKKSRLKKWNR